MKKNRDIEEEKEKELTGEMIFRGPGAQREGGQGGGGGALKGFLQE